MDIKLTIGLVVATVLLAAAFAFKNSLFPCCRRAAERRRLEGAGYTPQPGGLLGALGPQPVHVIAQPAPNMLVVQAEAVAVTPAVLATVAVPIAAPVAAPIPGTAAAP